MSSLNQQMWQAAQHAGKCGMSAAELSVAMNIQDPLVRMRISSLAALLAHKGILVRVGHCVPARYVAGRAIRNVGRAATPALPSPSKLTAKQELRRQYMQWRLDQASNPLSINQRIRNILREHGPMTAECIFKLLAVPHSAARTHLFPAITGMVNDGLLDVVLGTEPRQYRFLRDATRRTPDGLTLRERARQARTARAAARALERQRVREERIAARQAEKEAARQARKSATALRKQQAERERIRLQALAAMRPSKSVPAPPPVRPPHAQDPHFPRHLPAPVPAAMATSVSDDVAAFLAAGGCIQVLPDNFDNRNFIYARRPGMPNNF